MLNSIIFAAILVQAVPNQPNEVCPILVGQSLPTLYVKDADGQPFEINAALKGQTAVLVFYRGSWCPFCNRHLAQLQDLLPKLRQQGISLYAISPDRPAIMESPLKRHKLGYTLLSDSSMQAAKAMGIAFKLDDTTVSMYKSSYQIDIEADSGQAHHLLPVPSIFIVDTEGIIQFSYSNPNYKVRLHPDILLSAIQSLN